MNNSENKPAVTGRRKTPGNLILGIALLVVGSLLFAREFGADLPNWFFRWELILVVVGISIGLKSGFRDFGWIAVTGLGLFFLSDDIFPGWNATRFLVPAGLLALGAFIILNRMSASAHRTNFSRFSNPNIPGTENTNPEYVDQSIPPQGTTPSEQFNNKSEQFNNKAEQFGNKGEQFSNKGEQFSNKGEQFSNSSEQFSNRGEQFSNRGEQFGNRSEQYSNRAQMEEEQLDIVSVFSAVNRKVFSKNFIGGEIVCVFGGSEVNMMNADISAGTVELEVVCIFGGATLFIPPNWNVRSEMGSVFGGVDDKRRNSIPDPGKTLIIKGVCIFGGLEVKTKYQ
ncbi:LiaF transmembrane domain-containing protein [Flavitalea sp.]|nr:hypothetical protein [Flavitalea sp.]